MLNPNHLATFVAVVRNNSFRAAATDHGVSQATVSHHIQQLETQLGVELIDRRSDCTPTPAGARLLPHARSLLRTHERALAAVAKPRMRVGAASNIGIYMLPPILQRLSADTNASNDPDVTIDTNHAIASALNEGGLDLALLETTEGLTGDAAIRHWRDEPLVVIVPPDHHWRQHSAITPRALAHARLLGGEPGTGTGRLLRQFLAHYDTLPDVSAQLGSTEAVKSAVAHGQGISLVLASSVVDEVASGRLIALPLSEGGLAKPLWAACRGRFAATGNHSLLEQLLASDTRDQDGGFVPRGATDRALHPTTSCSAL